MDSIQLEKNISLSNFTTWRIGGPAEWIAQPKNIKEINNKTIGNELKKLKPNLKIYTPDNNQNLIKLIKEHTLEKDLILILGAGDINLICENIFLEFINTKSSNNDLAA